MNSKWRPLCFTLATRYAVRSEKYVAFPVQKTERSDLFVERSDLEQSDRIPRRAMTLLPSHA